MILLDLLQDAHQIKKIDTTYVANKHVIKENNGTYTVSENKVLETKDEKSYI